MVKMAKVVDPIVYEDGIERRSLDLRPDGIACIPFLGLSNFQSVRTGTQEHVHPGCVEISLCLRGNLMFESFGMEYPFLPSPVLRKSSTISLRRALLRFIKYSLSPTR